MRQESYLLVTWTDTYRHIKIWVLFFYNNKFMGFKWTSWPSLTSVGEQRPLALRSLMGFMCVRGWKYKPTDTFKRVDKFSNTHTYTFPPFFRYVSVPVLSHWVINISAISIIDRKISPLRCTKIIQTFLCWNWSINISPACCLLKGWKVEKACCALLFCSTFTLYCENEKHTSLSVSLSSSFFSFTLQFLSLDHFDALHALFLSVYFSFPPWFFLPFFLFGFFTYTLAEL